MSDGNKTEKPTPKRLQDARKKGQVAVSQEIKSTLVLGTCFVYVYAFWDSFQLRYSKMIEHTVQAVRLPFDEGWALLGPYCLETLTHTLLIMVGMVILMSLISSLSQVGFLFTFKPVKPDLKKLSPKQYYKKVVSAKGLVRFVLSIVKTAAVFFIGTVIFLKHFNSMFKAQEYGVEGYWLFVKNISLELAVWSIGVYAAFAFCDLFFQRYNHTKQLMMSKEDIKQEYKESEGDPEVKSKRKQLAQEIAMSDARAQVKKSSVLVTNPTRLAIALRYEEGETDLPVIMVKGRGAIAQHMIKVAQEEGIPVMRNVPLAHDLYNYGQLMEYIPSELVEPVAEVLAWARDIKRGQE